MAVGDYQDSSTADLNDILAMAASLGATPTFTSVMLYGNYVVIDGVGHAASLYAHIEALTPGLKVGQPVKAGHLLGRVGNSGTIAAATGHSDRQVHLHWELHINGRYLGEGLSEGGTRAVYTALFGGFGQ